MRPPLLPAQPPTNLKPLSKLPTVIGRGICHVKSGRRIHHLNEITPCQLAELIDLILDETISGKIAKDVFTKLWETGKSPSQLVEELALRQITDTSAIEQIIDTLFTRTCGQGKRVPSGQTTALWFFVGLAMKATAGKANPVLSMMILKKKLNQ